jgi:ribonuclease P/MRP protein subunit POP7
MSATVPASAPISPAPFNVSAELKALKHEKQNANLKRLPPTHTIQRRPLNHAPIADIRSSSNKQPKIVYVSRRTPAIAAVKRVKKYLLEAEKRALKAAGANVSKTGSRRGPIQAVEQANERLKRDKEEVLVKASGRAMEQALRIAEWFRTKEKDLLCDVEVRTGSVRAIDDIVEVERDDDGDKADEDDGKDIVQEDQSMEVTLGDTTLEILKVVGGNEGTPGEIETLAGETSGRDVSQSTGESTDQGHSSAKSTRRSRKRRRRETYDEGDVPEARLRWVKTIEIAISLKG